MSWPPYLAQLISSLPHRLRVIAKVGPTAVLPLSGDFSSPQESTTDRLIRLYGLPVRLRVHDQRQPFAAVVSPAFGLPLAIKPEGSAEALARDAELLAWELACHASQTTVFAAQRLFALSVSARYRPSQTVPSARKGHDIGSSFPAWQTGPPSRHPWTSSDIR